jgi:hypothetical protein
MVRLVGALLLEQNDEWAVQRACYMTLESVARLNNDPLSPARSAALISAATPDSTATNAASYTTRWDTISPTLEAVQAWRRDVNMAKPHHIAVCVGGFVDGVDVRCHLAKSDKKQWVKSICR